MIGQIRTLVNQIARLYADEEGENRWEFLEMTEELPSSHVKVLWPSSKNFLKR